MIMDFKNLHNWIIIIIFVIVLGQCVISHEKYKTLQENYNKLLFEKSNIIDSLNIENDKKLESICNLEKHIDILNLELDSLYNIKSNVIQKRNKFTVSKNISDGSNLLKKNLNENNINNTF